MDLPFVWGCNLLPYQKNLPGASFFSVFRLDKRAVSTTENALTAHVQLHDLSLLERMGREIRTFLHAHGIHHATLEFENEGVCPSVDFSTAHKK